MEENILPHFNQDVTYPRIVLTIPVVIQPLLDGIAS
jgi:hypothetical protein